jgi:hypothetical protein
MVGIVSREEVIDLQQKGALALPKAPAHSFGDQFRGSPHGYGRPAGFTAVGFVLLDAARRHEVHEGRTKDI